ncbi:MAG: hypothetical protein ACI39F_03265 [Acutalibacteraceae bacterium]
MGFFEDAVVKAKDAFDVAAKKTNEVVSLQKLKIKVSQVNSDLSKDFETLGRLYFESVKDSDEEVKDFKEIIESIEGRFTELEDLEAQIDAQKKNKVCKKCNFKNPEEAVFCAKCGEKL